MQTKNTIEIALSKNKTYKMLFGSLLFVVMAAWLIYARKDYGNPILILIVGIIAILFFGYIAFFLIKALPDKKPGLIISTEGIVDNASAVAAGFIQWEDVQEIKVAQVMNQKFLMIMVSNPEEYINRRKGAVARNAMQMNYKSYGSPISISANALAISFDELHQIVLDRFNQSKSL